CLHSYSTPLTF
nr:immunoglobulin light chain junction region [Macaca mulatta]